GLYDAVGVRIDEVPIEPHRVLEALRRKAARKPPRVGPDSVPDVAWPEPIVVPTPWDGGDGKAAGSP
ncbi:MAG: hypothetical protein HY608_11300, partial [Planctomycetes bacterium]|nr:hypothetical protein [Planctomycetota bacterium]